VLHPSLFVSHAAPLATSICLALVFFFSCHPFLSRMAFPPAENSSTRFPSRRAREITENCKNLGPRARSARSKDLSVESQVMALLSRCSGLARAGPLRGPGHASLSRCPFAMVLEQPGSLSSLFDSPHECFRNAYNNCACLGSLV